MSDENIHAQCKHLQSLLSAGRAEERIALRVARHVADGALGTSIPIL
ncbi:MAG: hypothetical protein ABJF01_23570 [bacterium]